MVRRMRIISGSAGRMAIKVPASVTRPTTDFVRQAAFSILGESIGGARVLDLFAGSGALGLEALSRGAATCVFVERQRAASKVIADNLGKTRLGGGRVVNATVDSFLKRDAAAYDVVFADPPYWRNPGDPDDLKMLLGSDLLASRVVDGGWLVAEASSHYQPPASAHFTLHDRRAYGSSALLFFKKPAANDG